MNFKLWFENSESNPIIFLDLDETLVSTLGMPSNPKNLEEMKNLGGVPVNQSHVSFLRPHAIEFVNNLKAIAKVCILTAGRKKFQKNVFGIEDYDLIKPENNILPKSENSVLVDDLEHHAPNTMSKLYALNINEHRHIKVNPFNFNPIIAKKLPRFYENDDELLKIQTQILNML